jgi:transcriptional regulator with XRE-family HTH domain
MKQPELGQKVIELRKKKGLTQEELVEKCNLNVRTLQRIESGEVNPRDYTIKSIFKALDYDGSNSSNNENRIIIYLTDKIKTFYNQIQNPESMKNSKGFFYNFFLSLGIVWFFCALSILILKLNFQAKEIVLTVIFPLAYAILKQFDKKESSKAIPEKSE